MALKPSIKPSVSTESPTEYATTVEVREALHRTNSLLGVIKMHLWGIRHQVKTQQPVTEASLSEHLGMIDKKTEEVADIVAKVQKFVKRQESR
jgi:hypothetical protein